MVDGNAGWSGLEVEACRAVAVAVFGPNARFVYHSYDSAKDYDHVRDGGDDVSFLTYTEMRDEGLIDRQLAGPPVFIETQDLMVGVNSPLQHLDDVIGKGLCFMTGSEAERSLQAYYLDRKADVIWMPYTEDVEMNDAYNVGRCKAVAGESTTLATTRLAGGVNRLKSRLMTDHLMAFPIMATTPLKDDAQWATITAWTIYTLLNADRQGTNYRPNYLQAMTIDGQGLGLAKDWQKNVVAAVGSYSAIFRRTLGAGSPFKLEAGLNKTSFDGGMLIAPFAQ